MQFALWKKKRALSQQIARLEDTLMPVEKFKAFFVKNQHLKPGEALNIMETATSGTGATPTGAGLETAPLPITASSTEIDYSNLKHPAANTLQTAER